MSRPGEPTYQVLERGQLLGLDEFELVDKVDEVLEARVEVGLSAQPHDLLEVRVVDVRVDPEQPREDLLHHRLEVLGERRPCRAVQG